jgi:hypothetical protein
MISIFSGNGNSNAKVRKILIKTSKTFDKKSKVLLVNQNPL